MNFRLGLILAGSAMVFVSTSVEAQEPLDNKYTGLASISLEAARTAMLPIEAAAAYQKALDLALDGIAELPMNSQSHLQAARAYMGLGRYTEADASFSRTEELWPDYLEETLLFRESGWVDAYNEALELREVDEQAALDLFIKANIVLKDRPEAYLSIASILAGRSEYQEAIDAYEEVVRSIDLPATRDREEETLANWADFRTMALLNIGQLYLGTDRPEEAAEAYQAVLDADPDNGRARGSLAIAVAAGGEGEAALGMYEKILADTLSSEYDFYNAGVGFYQAEVWDRAAVAFRLVVDSNPMHRDALQNMAQSMLLAGQYEELLPFSKQLLEMDPQNEVAFRFHARALVETGKSDEGVALMETMAELPFLVDNLRLTAIGTTDTRIDGLVVNKTLEEGVSVTLRFHFFDREGTDLGTKDVDVTTGAVDVAMAFQVQFSSDQPAGGYSYEVVG
ncbi:MAG: tetratricopeptide repeat protein [Gemmatimonadetes bacterium]|nr:tetratricopeptide repeat protein [Gemmatimonadota bacterium]